MNRASRCPFCIAQLPRQSFVNRLLSVVRTKEVCVHCGRTFRRAVGAQVGHLYDHIVQSFEDRLAGELKTLPVCDRAEMLVEFGMRMEDAKVGSVQMLLRTLTELLESQLAGLARGCEGKLDIGRVEKRRFVCVDIDAMVEDGKHSRRRLRIGRIDTGGFIMVDRDKADVIQSKQIAR